MPTVFCQCCLHVLAPAPYLGGSWTPFLFTSPPQLSETSWLKLSAASYLQYWGSVEGQSFGGSITRVPQAVILVGPSQECRL